MDILAHVSMCGSVFMMVALTFERHFAIWSVRAVSIDPCRLKPLG